MSNKAEKIISRPDYVTDGDNNWIQAFLKNMGRTRLDRTGRYDQIQSMSRTDVRKEGVKELGRKAAIGAIAVGSITAVGVALIGYAADHNPEPITRAKFNAGEGRADSQNTTPVTNPNTVNDSANSVRVNKP